MKSNLFKLGFEDVKAMDAEAKAVSSNRGIYDFYVKDGQETLMRFLPDQPVAFKAHTIKVGKAPRVFVCTEDENCLGCKQPDSFDATKMNKASVKAAFTCVWSAQRRPAPKIFSAMVGAESSRITAYILGMSLSSNRSPVGFTSWERSGCDRL